MELIARHRAEEFSGTIVPYIILIELACGMVCLSESHQGLNFREVICAQPYFYWLIVLHIKLGSKNIKTFTLLTETVFTCQHQWWEPVCKQLQELLILLCDYGSRNILFDKPCYCLCWSCSVGNTVSEHSRIFISAYECMVTVSTRIRPLSALSLWRNDDQGKCDIICLNKNYTPCQKTKLLQN